MKLTLQIACSLLIAGAASAQVAASDDFAYVGDLTANGWTAHSGAGNKVIASDGSVATLEFSSGSGEDVNLPFTPFTAADTIYASFVLNVPSGNLVNPDVNGSYFAHLKDTSFGFRGRVGLLSAVSGGDFTIGINADSSSIGNGAVWGADLSFDTNYSIVFSWDAVTGTSNLWVDPTAIGSTSISHTGTNTGTIIEQFALRQSNDHTGFILVDDIVVGNSFADVSSADPANTNIPAASPTGCNGALVHYTSGVNPPSASSPATWAAGTNAVVTVENLDLATNIGILVFGGVALNLSLFGGEVVPSPDVLAAVIGAGGQASLSLAIPSGLGGFTFYTQFVGIDTCVAANEFTFSNAQSHLFP
jgi:hypothetical protein